MTATLHQRLAASNLLLHAERIAASGKLPFGQEMQLRNEIAEVRSAFADEIPQRPANSNTDPDAQLYLVAQEMDRGDSLC